ncbi:MAG: hypothetical protein ACI84C_001158 [Flavobacteriales bacterium]|jgi:hypothetical protein
MFISSKNQELAVHLDQSEIVVLVKEQVDRDFHFFSLVVNWSEEDSSAKALWSSLANLVEYLMEKDKNRLMQVIYRIDLAEGELTEVLTDFSIEDVNGRIASLILFRELQKVILRKHYSSNAD